MSNESRFPAWAWWIIGAVTMLAISILIFSVVLGIRAGQQQVEIQRRQQIGISLQQAVDLQAEGNIQAAFDAYQKVLVLDPSNVVAQQGIKNLLNVAAAGTPLAAPPVAQPTQAIAEVAAAAPPAAPAVTTFPAPTTAVQAATAAITTTTASIAGSYWDKAQEAVKAGRWQEALANLTMIKQADAAFRTAEVDNLLYASYTNLAVERDNEDNLEEALQFYDQALLLRPDALDIQRERTLIATYLDVLTYSDADWPRAISLLETLFAEDPQYRDVEERLLNAHVAYGDQLVSNDGACDAVAEYDAALQLMKSPDAVEKRDVAQTQCTQGGIVAANSTPGIHLTPGVTAGVTPGATPAATAAPAFASNDGAETAGDGPAIGRILYSAMDPITGRSQVMALAVGKGQPAQLIVPDAAQPALRSDGTRLAFRNLRGNMAGLSSIDPATGLTLRFTDYAEDSVPSWNPQGSRVAFASNREGDRRWRIYLVWAENDGATDTLDFGESPSWHPLADTIAFRGCDPSGNGCGLWTISSSGSSRAPLTTVPDDERPAWGPDGSFVVFMSSSRDGNYELYRVETNSGQVTRLTNNAAIDVLPAVSPDGEWVAFASNRDGSWKLWAVPSSGGPETLIGPIVGQMSNWTDQGIQWTY